MKVKYYGHSLALPSRQSRLLNSLSFLLFTLLIVAGPQRTFAQTRGNLSLMGDVKVDESRVEGKKPGSLGIVLYSLGGVTSVGRQNVPVNGRYRFNNLNAGEYEIAVEVENNEIARVHVLVSGRPGSEVQQDLEFEWKDLGSAAKRKASTISALDAYTRSSANESLFQKAQQAADKKNYADAVLSFKQIVERDNLDFQAWTELGTCYLLLDKKAEAEKAYEKAIEARPTFVLALLNLARIRIDQKKYEDAISSLTKVLEINSASADANLLLGEAYLQIKKGSKAVGYLNEAARLGKPEAHLRLAALYDVAGLKDRAAIEYEQFLKKKPDYVDRKKLEKYIAENTKK
ncbi:MAG TPA: tetratricopeptide repeat protein [Pyrinomonadaceae bacterium]|nr:tetratricopeptide repeat protein [Pyrinomonadaceae bacterium]